MRQYLLFDNGDDRKVREERVKISVAEVEKDPICQKMVLRLEPAPLITHDFNKGKGLVFSYDSSAFVCSEPHCGPDSKILENAIRSGSAMKWKSSPISIQSEGEKEGALNLASNCLDDSMVFRDGFYEASPSGIKPRKYKPRKRPQKVEEFPKGWWRIQL